jgi:predicted dienelactone hydrolase
MTTFTSRLFCPWHLLVLALIALPIVSFAQTVTGVGFQSVTIHDPVNGGSMPGYVFYPSASAKGVTWVGYYKIHATMNAPAIAGAKPLVVISHGHGGSNIDLHDLATYLASHGFIAATLQHPKDNYLDASGAGAPSVLDGRPIQVKATISRLLNDSHWKTLIDPNRIGVAGFSAGGYTALMLAGAVPQFDRYISFCKQYPQDAEMCAGLKQAEALMGTTRMKVYFAGVQSMLDRWGNPHDPRVKAAFAMAPVSFVFDEAGLASIDRPVFLYYAQDSHILPPKANALRIAPLIKTLVGIKMIPKAGHFVFVGPCSAKLAKAVPRICEDPPGVDRAKAYVQVDADALNFFRTALMSSRK